VDSYHYCLTCYRHIELNPVRANMVRPPTSHPWSSFHFNAMSKPDPLVTPHDCWLLLGECDHTRSEAYQALFSENLKPADIDCIRHSV
jgi:putative transposase